MIQEECNRLSDNETVGKRSDTNDDTSNNENNEDTLMIEETKTTGCRGSEGKLKQ